MLFTKPQILRRIQREVDKHRNLAAAAKSFGVSHAVLSNVLADRVPVPPKIRDIIGVKRVTLYVDQIDDKYLDGSQYIP